MSPTDMLIFFFFILVCIKAAIDCKDYWLDKEEECEALSRSVKAASRRAHMVSRRPAASRPAIPSKPTVAMRPSLVRITPIKRVNRPAAYTGVRICKDVRQYHLKDKGVA